jgi:hypothetical protein
VLTFILNKQIKNIKATANIKTCTVENEGLGAVTVLHWESVCNFVPSAAAKVPCVVYLYIVFILQILLNSNYKIKEEKPTLNLIN